MIHTITGNNTDAIYAHMRDIVKAVVSEHGDMSLERIDAAEIDSDTVLQAVQTMPFLVDTKTIVLTNIDANKKLADVMEMLIDRTHDNVSVYIVYPKPDKRTVLYKTLKKHTNMQEFKSLQASSLYDWIGSIVENEGGSIDRSTASYLVEYVGENQMKLRREIEKLLLHDNIITKASIELLCDKSPEQSIFALLGKVFNGSGDQVIKIYRELRAAGQDPAYITTMLTWQIHNIAQAVVAPQKTQQALVSAGQSPYTATQSLDLARRIDRDSLEKIVAGIVQADLDIKTTASDRDAVVETFLLEAISLR